MPAVLENMLIISIIVVILTVCNFECSNALSTEKLCLEKALLFKESAEIENFEKLLKIIVFVKLKCLYVDLFLHFVFWFLMRPIPFQRKQLGNIKIKELFYKLHIFLNFSMFQYRFNLSIVNWYKKRYYKLLH